MMKALPIAILSGLIFGVVGIFCAVHAVLFVIGIDYLNAVVALGMSVFCLAFVVPFFKVVPGNVTPRADTDGRGTTFRPDRAIDIPIQVSIIGLVVASSVYSIFAPLGMVSIPVPPSLRFSIPFLGGVVVLVGVPLVWRNLRRGSTKYLRLSEDGFELSQGWHSHTGEWARVKDVTDEVPGRQAKTPGAVVFVMSGENAPMIAAGSITPEGAALREVARLYWMQPQLRNELADGRAIERLTRTLNQD